jgi:hypothetical protein
MSNPPHKNQSVVPQQNGITLFILRNVVFITFDG